MKRRLLPILLRSMALRMANSRPTTPGSYTNADISTVVTSRRVYPGVSGAISVEAGLEYEINGDGSWVTAPGTITEDDYYRVRLTSSASYETLTELDVTVDGVAYTFSVTTMADPVKYLYFGEDNVLFGEDDVTM